MKNHLYNITIVIFSTLLLSCAGDKNTSEQAADILGEQILYDQAKSAIQRGNFESAITYFQSLESRFPFSKYALQAQLDLAYAYYRHNQRERAISQADRFIRLNPTHEFVDYAHYLKGIANFVEEPTFLAKLFPRPPSELDQEPLLEAYKEFTQLIRKYPNSRYAPDAHQRLIYLRNELANNELKIAQYYLRRKAYIAAANRAKYILENFPEAPCNIEAVATMVSAYRKLDDQALISSAERVLALNAPQHPLLKQTDRSLKKKN